MENEAGFAGGWIDAEDAAIDGDRILRIDDPELVVLVSGERGKFLDGENAFLVGGIPDGDGEGLRAVAEEGGEGGDLVVGEFALGGELTGEVGDALVAGGEFQAGGGDLFARSFELAGRVGGAAGGLGEAGL